MIGFSEHFDAVAREFEFALARLVAIGCPAHVDNLRLIAFALQLLGKNLMDIRLGDDFGFKIKSW